jgi:hypothetical protein
MVSILVFRNTYLKNCTEEEQNQPPETLLAIDEAFLMD